MTARLIAKWVSKGPVAELRRAACLAPFVLLAVLAITSAIREGVDGASFTLRLDRPVAAGLIGYATLFTARAPLCRDEAEFRAARGWFFAALGLLMATVAVLVALGRGTPGTAVAFGIALPIAALGGAVIGRGRWLARERG